MHGLQRRPSGIYIARLVVPAHLRKVLCRTEFVQSTGTRELTVAKVVAGELMSGWRRALLRADRRTEPMDLARVASGSPLLAGTGYLDLVTAGQVSGLGTDALLRAAAQGSLDLFVLAGNLRGHLVPLEELEANLDPYTSGTCEYVVPAPDDMPPEAWEMAFTGLLQILDPITTATTLLSGSDALQQLFLDPGSPGHAYAPDEPMCVDLKVLQADLRHVEAMRHHAASLVTPGQLAALCRTADVAPGTQAATWRVSDAVTAFMKERAAQCSPEHARRVRAACDLFIELMGDPLVTEINRASLKRYRDDVLPTVPARENQLRAMHRTTSVSESIPIATKTGWPRLSSEEQGKRLAWFAECVTWMAREGWITGDPTEKLVTPTGRGGRRGRDQDRREAFGATDLTLIFTAEWFAQGKGRLTKQGTYREYLPSYFWLPALGLFTGARVNELSQLYLTDLRQSATGVWFFDINDEGDKRLKNPNSRRLLPVHPKLIEWGLIRWKERLEADGFNRLFPELRSDAAKGYSKDAVKWFSRFLLSRGLARDGRRVFHSFRHRFATECLNRLALPEATVAQLTGHARGSSVLSVTYRKDAPPDDLVAAVSRLDFDLPAVAVFDLDAGAKALLDALQRKNGGRGEGHH